MRVNKFFAALAAIFMSGAVAGAANLSLLSGPNYSDPSQVLATVNTLIQNINTGVGGLVNAQTGTATTSVATTTEQTLLSYTLAPGALATAGQSIRAYCWGHTSANTNNKTMKLYFGSTSVTTPAAGTNNLGWWLEIIVMRRTATTQGFLGKGLVNTTAVAPSLSDAAENLANSVLIKCTGTNGNASSNEITASGMIVESIK